MVTSPNEWKILKWDEKPQTNKHIWWAYQGWKIVIANNSLLDGTEQGFYEEHIQYENVKEFF